MRDIYFLDFRSIDFELNMSDFRENTRTANSHGANITYMIKKTNKNPIKRSYDSIKEEQRRIQQ